MSRRSEDTVPKLVVVCVLFLVALHVKLNSETSESTPSHSQNIFHSVPPDVISGAHYNVTKSPPVYNTVLHNNNASNGNGSNKELFWSNLRLLIKQKSGIERDIFIDVPHRDSIPTPIVHGADCNLLFQRDHEEIERTAFHQEDHIHVPTSDKSYIFNATKCPDFIKSRHYVMKAINKEEENYPIAFSILAFKDVEQTERLLRMVYRPQNYYCLHVDVKSSPEVFAAISSIAACFPNVLLASKRSNVRWGWFTVLEPELTCLQDLSRWTWKYFINLTGQEMPLKTNYQLVNILQVFNGANDVECIIKRRNKSRVKFIYKDGVQTEELKSAVPHNITIVKGSIHAVLSRGFCDYMLNNPVAKDFTEWLKDTGVPDETLFATLNRNPQFRIPGAYLGKDETHPENNPTVSRFKNWGEYPCAGKMVRHVCVLSVGDIWLLKDRYELFANKFDANYNRLAYDCMEQWYFDNVHRELKGKTAFDTSYYKQLSFVKQHL